MDEAQKCNIYDLPLFFAKRDMQRKSVHAFVIFILFQYSLKCVTIHNIRYLQVLVNMCVSIISSSNFCLNAQTKVLAFGTFWKRKEGETAR